MSRKKDQWEALSLAFSSLKRKGNVVPRYLAFKIVTSKLGATMHLPNNTGADKFTGVINKMKGKLFAREVK